MKNKSSLLGRLDALSCRHPELDSGSRCYKKGGIPNQVWNDNINTGGFTLIELLVVVLIIGILASVALPQYQKAVAKSRLTQMLVRVKALHDGAEVYYLANGFYPNDVRDVDIDITSGAEVKQNVGWTNSSIPSAFYPDGMECIIIGGHYVGCAQWSKNVYVQKSFNHAVGLDVSTAGKTSCCGAQNTMMDEVCRSAAHKTVRDWVNGNYHYNCYFLE